MAEGIKCPANKGKMCNLNECVGSGSCVIDKDADEIAKKVESLITEMAIETSNSYSTYTESRLKLGDRLIHHTLNKFKK